MATDTAQQLNLRTDVIKPLPKQAEFLDAMYSYEYLLFGGAAGGGKSRILRWAAVELLCFWAQKYQLTNVMVGLFCEDYPSLKDRHISKMQSEFPRWLGEIKDTKEDGLCFFLAQDYGGGKIALRNLDDPSKYQSTEFAAILVDELTRNPRETFDNLRFRKRWPGLDHSPFLAATNPSGIGHGWVKKLWIDRDFSGDDALLPAAAFKFVPAFARENPHLPPSYWSTLHSLPPMMRKAMEEGSWDLFSGQYFEEWNRAVHVCRPFPIPTHWKRLISLDYGYERPSAVGWWAIDPEDHLWLYREIYRNKLTYPALASEILERTPLNEAIDYAVADPAIWGVRPTDQETPGQTGGEILTSRLKERGINLVRGNHDRIQGWQRCRSRMTVLPGPDNKPFSHLHVFETCPNFIRTVPSLIHNEHKPEDLDSDGEDHHADQWRYLENSKAVVSKIQETEARYSDLELNVPINAGYGFDG